MRISLVIPAYNEAAKILNDLKATRDYLESRKFPSEVLIVDDGSHDPTASIVREFIALHNPKTVAFRLLSYGENRGKGYAIRYGVDRAEGEVVAFMDSGLCVPLRFLEVGIEKLKEGYDFAIASRRVKNASIRRSQPTYRRVGSQVFRFGVTAVMGIDVTDTQCGFKVYSQKAAKAIFSRVKTDGFMFDIEALLVAKRLGLKAAEFGVEWSNDGDTRYHPVWGTLRNIKELIRIRARV